MVSQKDTFRTRDLVIVAIPALLIGFATLEAMEILDPDHVGDV